MLDKLSAALGEGADKVGLTQVVSHLVQKHGGISGLIERFKAVGLGEKAQSWLSNEANQHVTGPEVEEALDADALDDAAETLGTDRAGAASRIADVLPKVIDMLSPSGKAPSDAKVSETLSGLADKFLG